ncbi:MAG: hypothetical protein GY851_29575 [bacterium]|nr:hypothetical protein [bacterium]
MRTILFGAEADTLREEVQQHDGLELVEASPEVVVCYGGDGTLLSAELEWPGVPKVPIKNSRRGIRCLPHPPHDVIARLAAGGLARTPYMKIECALRNDDHPDPVCTLTAMNEINVHMGTINSAVRFKLWIDDIAYLDGQEIIGDGCVIATPFGSTAYFNHLTRGVFHAGIGIAFKASVESTSHVVAPESSTFRVLITRGPAVLGFDNSQQYFDLAEGDELTVHKHPAPAIILTWDAMPHPSDEF